jgi:hypothetical protein
METAPERRFSPLVTPQRPLTSCRPLPPTFDLELARREHGDNVVIEATREQLRELRAVPAGGDPQAIAELLRRFDKREVGVGARRRRD